MFSPLQFSFSQQPIGNAVYEDFDQLANAFKKNHQGLYFYTDTLTTNKKIDSLRATLSEAMELPEFFAKISALVALTNEGHTNLKYPKKALRELSKKKVFLPFGIAICDDEMIINGVYDKELSELRHHKVIRINGKSPGSIVEELIPYIATDGFNITSAKEWMGWDFPFFYYLLEGGSPSFDLVLENLDGKRVDKTIQPINYKQVVKENNSDIYLFQNGTFKFRDFKILNEDTAILTVSGFFGRKDFDKFYRNSFSTIKEKGMKNLIIDIQRNVGGQEGLENLLASYLWEEPFQKYAMVNVPRSAYQKNRNAKAVRRDGWYLKKGIPHRGISTLQSDFYDNEDFILPTNDLIFNGNVYVLTSGVTFSGGAEFASMLKLRDRAIFIGEEVGGAHAGNVSGHSNTITLKNTKIKVDLPVVHFKMNLRAREDGSHGVVPDYFVPQSWGDLVKGKNSKLLFVLDLIEKIHK